MNSHLRSVCAGYSVAIEQLARGRGQIDRVGSVRGLFSGLPIPPFNAIHAWEDDPTIEDDVRELVDGGSTKELPMSISVPVGAPQEERVVALAQELGFAQMGETEAAMVLHDVAVPDRPAGITCTFPTGRTDLTVISGVMGQAFGGPPELQDQIMPPDVLDWDDTEWFVLTVDDEPVAVSMLILLDDVANVFNVGVPPEHRRRGYGAAATWEVVRRGRERGSARTVLLASQMGEPVYERMGFETVGRIRSLMRF